MKKTVFYLLFLTCIVFSAFSQSFINPDDAFYSDVNRWEIEGIIDSVPQIRPYSYPVIKSMLETVIENGSDRDVQSARVYLDKLVNEAYGLSLEAEADIAKTEAGTCDAEAGTVRFSGSVGINSLLFMNYDLGVTGVKGDFCLPSYRALSFDMADDPTTVGPIEINLNFNNLLSLGTDEIGLVAGISRSAFGQYPDSSIVLDSSTFHAPFFNLFIQRPSWSYTQSTYILSATDNSGGGAFTGKFMNLHDVTFRLLPELSLSYYETIISGGKTDFQYLLPCPFMVSQSFGDFADNLQMGIGLTYKPLKGLKLTGDVYVDDLSANDIVKLNFDTKMIIAAQLTAQYVPSHSAINRIYAEGMLLAPRMYAHSDVAVERNGTYHYAAGSDVNYQNYTHHGECLATKIWPNSIACTLGSDIEPVRNLKLNASLDFVCHANVNETIETEQAKKYLKATISNANCRTDGSVFNFPGFPNESESPLYNNINNYPESYTHHLPFLEQQTKQYVLHLDTGVSYAFKITKTIDCTVSLNNVFEYIRNDGVQNEIFPASGITAPTDADVEAALAAWRNAIVPDTLKDFLTVSAKVSF